MGKIVLRLSDSLISAIKQNARLKKVSPSAVVDAMMCKLLVGVSDLTERFSASIEYCAVPSCPRETKTLGLCVSHYSSIYYWVKQGNLTWDWLAAHNKINPRRGERRPTLEEVKDFTPKLPRNLKGPALRWFFKVGEGASAPAGLSVSAPEVPAGLPVVLLKVLRAGEGEGEPVCYSEAGPEDLEF